MDLFELSAALKMDTSQYEKSLDNAEKEGKSFLKRTGELVDNIGRKWLSLKMTANAVKTFFAPITNVVKNSTQSFAEYEQLVGGVQTLFKKSAGFVIQDARNAYKTAGMSMNQYMDTVTSFAASMINGLGGDTLRAAEMSQQAITDMSDNANKMGTDMEAIENAYKGFSKQNYTMLDNLKLGYGGTKTEMQRLLKDAEELTGKKYDISNFADITEAIHAIQTQMGITGTTAKEAETTIQGSAKAMSASWQNLLTVMGDRKAVKNLPKFTKQFTDSAKTYLKNLLPVVRTSISSLGTVVEELGPIIGKELPGLISDILPIITKAGWTLAKGIGKGLFQFFKTARFKRMFTDAFKLQPNASWSDVGKAFVDKVKEGIDKAKSKLKLKLSSFLGLTNDKGLLTDGTSWIDIGKAAIQFVYNGIKNWSQSEKVSLGEKLGLCDSEGNTESGAALSWTDIGKKILEEIWGGVSKYVNEQKIKLGEKLGLCDSLGNPTTGASFGWSDIGKSIIQKIKDGTSKFVLETKIKLAEKLGLATNTGDAQNPSESYSWGDIGKNLIGKIKDGAKNFADSAKIKLGEILGLCDSNGNTEAGDGVSWEDIGSDILTKITKGINKGGGFVKRLLSGKNKAQYDNWVRTLGRDPTWSEVIDSVWGKIEAVIKEKDLIGLIFSKFSEKTLAVSNFVGKLIGAIGDWFGNKSNIDAVASFVESFLTGAVNSITIVLDKVSTLLEDTGFVENIANAISILLEAVVKALPSVINAIATIIKTVFNSNQFTTSLTNLVKALVDAFTAVLPSLVGALSSLFEDPAFVSSLVKLVYAVGKGVADLTAALASTTISEGARAIVDGIYGEGHYAKYVEPLLGTNKQTTTPTNGYTNANGDYVGEGSTVLSRTAGTYEGFADRMFRLFYGMNSVPAGDTLQGWETLINVIEKAMGRTITPEEVQAMIDAGVRTPEAFDVGISSGEVEIKNGTVKLPDSGGNSGVVIISAEDFRTIQDIIGGASGGGFAKGLWSVPQDNYVARLHRGEMVLTASQARRYRDGDSGGDTGAIVSAIQELRNDMQNLRIFVGKKAFGQTVVDYSGKRMNGYLGRTEDKMISGYGWG